MAADLVRRRVAVIMAAGTAAALAAKAATTTIPIVFSTGGDPVESGLVASLARPGGNLTGTTRLLIEVGAKRLQLLHEMMPAARDVALLVNAGNRVMTEPQSRDAKAQVRTRGLKLHVLSASTEREIDEAFATLVKLRVGALMIAVDGFLTAQFTKIAALALQHKIPAIGSNRAFVDAGGLMSYGGNLDDGYAIAGAYAGRMLKGENPADLPVHRSTRFELFINRKTANSLGITIPLLLLAQADEMIE